MQMYRQGFKDFEEKFYNGTQAFYCSRYVLAINNEHNLVSEKTLDFINYSQWECEISDRRLTLILYFDNPGLHSAKYQIDGDSSESIFRI